MSTKADRYLQMLSDFVTGDEDPVTNQDVLLEAAAILRRLTDDPDDRLAECVTQAAFGERPDHPAYG